jgi:hypothetical protein
MTRAIHPRSPEFADAWIRAEPLLQPALDLAGVAFDLTDVFSAVASMDAQLWVDTKSAAVTRIEEYPRTRACRIWLAGGDLDELQDVEREIVDWAKTIGCSGVEIYGRRGWLKALEGYDEGATVMYKEIAA